MQSITPDLIASADLYGHIFSIGQLTTTQKRILDKRVKQGRAVKVKALWPWFLSGTREKTCYVNLETIPASDSHLIYR